MIVEVVERRGSGVGQRKRSSRYMIMVRAGIDKGARCVSSTASCSVTRILRCHLTVVIHRMESLNVVLTQCDWSMSFAGVHPPYLKCRISDIALILGQCVGWVSVAPVT
jgi:hypothetical protein